MVDNSKLLGAYARGPAFSWVHVRAINSSTSGFPNALVFCCCCRMKAGLRAYAPTSHAAAAAENQSVGKPDVDLFIARTDRHDLPPTNQPAKVTVPS